MAKCAKLMSISGNKTMILHRHVNCYGSYLLKDKSKRIPGATTMVHSRARALIKERANAANTDYQYYFKTRNSAMMDWARSDGDRIFDWKKDHSNPDDPKAAYIEFVVPDV